MLISKSDLERSWSEDLHYAFIGVRLVIGHTHCPMVYADLLADDGDMIDSFSFLYIQDGKWELKTLETG